MRSNGFSKEILMEGKRIQIAAVEASKNAYAPYSDFHVGAALLCEDGKIITGVNVENRSFGLTNCAERAAIGAAVSQGLRKYKGIAIYSPDSQELLSPCGACRQVLSEFCGPDVPIFLHGPQGWEKYTMKDLLPLDSLQHLKD